MIICYNARAMTGLKASAVVKRAKQDKAILESLGFTVLCPVVSENVRSTNKAIRAQKKSMDEYWPRDKAMIRRAHVVFNFSPDRPSLGVIREHGYSRYHLWKKVISIFPFGKIPKAGAVCHYEDDYVTDDLYSAAYEALRTHGTFWKRVKWRLGVYRRSWFKALIHRLGEWK